MSYLRDCVYLIRSCMRPLGLTAEHIAVRHLRTQKAPKARLTFESLQALSLFRCPHFFSVFFMLMLVHFLFSFFNNAAHSHLTFSSLLTVKIGFNYCTAFVDYATLDTVVLTDKLCII